MKILVTNDVQFGPYAPTILFQNGKYVYLEIDNNNNNNKKWFSKWQATSVDEQNLIKNTKILAKEQVQSLCDQKTQEAKQYIAGKKVTQEQLDRYKEKYEIAKKYLTDGSYADLLGYEAQARGMSVEELANVIVQKGDTWKENIVRFNFLIEAFKAKANSLIENLEIERLERILKEAQELGPNTTIEQILALFEEE